MKQRPWFSLIAILAALFASVPDLDAQGEWTWQNPFPTGCNLSDVHVTHPGVAFAVGTNSTLMKTTDSGRSWRLIPFDRYYEFNSIEFIDADNGILAANEGNMYRTSDGGESWELTPLFVEMFMTDVFMLDRRNAIAVGGNIIGQNIVFRSTDGGVSWTRGQAPELTAVFNGVWFTDSLNGWLVADGGYILRTTDAGHNWEVQAVADDKWGAVRLLDIVFVNRDLAFIVGDDGVMLRSVDGGESWSKHFSGSINDLYSIVFIDSLRGVAVGDRAVYTTDGGETWLENRPGVGLERVSASAESGWMMAVGAYGGMVTSSDSGRTWDRNSGTEFFGSVEAMDFCDLNHGIAVGERGGIAWTHDGGTNWELTLSVGPVDVLVAGYPVPERAYALREDRHILWSSDSGLTWTDRSDLSEYPVKGMDFVDGLTGVVVGDHVLLRTTDGGESWASIESVPDADLIAIRFVNESVGIAAGAGGAVYRTSDAGLTWESISNGLSEGYVFEQVVVTDPNTYVLRLSRAVVATSDGGATWTVGLAPNNERIYTIGFADAQYGWATGVNDIYYRTENGGQTWTLVRNNIRTSNRGLAALRGVYFFDRENGWFFGNEGYILKYTEQSESDVPTERPFVGESSHELIVIPNPGGSYLNVSIPGAVASEGVLVMYDATGQEVEPGQIERQASNSFSVDVGNFSPGLYLIEFRTPSGLRCTGSVIIRR